MWARCYFIHFFFPVEGDWMFKWSWRNSQPKCGPWPKRNPSTRTFISNANKNQCETWNMKVSVAPTSWTRSHLTSGLLIKMSRKMAGFCRQLKPVPVLCWFTRNVFLYNFQFQKKIMCFSNFHKTQLKSVYIKIIRSWPPKLSQIAQHKPIN